jgi:multidrug efflux pump subunit AcrA (membrane-fusion protein)
MPACVSPHPAPASPPPHRPPPPPHTPPPHPQGDSIRSGQTVAFVEQLGTFVEIKSQQGGEVVKFKAAEGDPVEYGQVVLELAPTFSIASPAT